MTGGGGTRRRRGTAHSPSATRELQRRGWCAGQAMRRGAVELAERRGAPLRPRGAVRRLPWAVAAPLKPVASGIWRRQSARGLGFASSSQGPRSGAGPLLPGLRLREGQRALVSRSEEAEQTSRSPDGLRSGPSLPSLRLRERQRASVNRGRRGCAGVALSGDGVRSLRVRASPYNPGLNLPRTSVAEFARSARVAQVKPKVVREPEIP
jgi:hypothetical protein